VKPRCTARVLWWDTLHNARCVRPAGHDDHHRDGVQWFDDDGMQVPYSPQIIVRSSAGHFPPRAPKPECSNDTCRAPAEALTLCSYHYQLAWKAKKASAA
jgi:hypothetical protein